MTADRPTTTGLTPFSHEASLVQQSSDLPQAVLFACKFNAIRSPMAASIMRYLVGKRVYVQSAGVRPGDTDPFAIAVMDEIGIDMARHEPQSIEDLEDTTFDLIVTLAPEAHHKALEFTRTMAVDVEYWPTLEPSATAGNREQNSGVLSCGSGSALRAHKGAVRPDRNAAGLAAIQLFVPRRNTYISSHASLRCPPRPALLHPFQSR